MKKELLDVTKKSGIVFIGRVVGLVFGVLFNFVAARYMGASIYGSFMYVYTLISFFPLIAKLGLDQGLVSFIPRLMEENELEKRNSIIVFSLILTLALSVILSIIIMFNNEFIASKILNNNQLSNLVKVLAPLIIFLSFIEFSKGIFRGIGKISYFVQSKNIILPSLKLFGTIYASFLGYRMFGLVVSFYIGLSVSVVYLLKRINQLDLLGKIDINNFNYYKEVIMFSFPLLMTGLLNFLVQKTDTFMIGYFLSELEVGIYNIALRIGTMSSFVLVAFNTMFAPVISSLYHKNEMKKLTNMYKVITKWILGINLIAFFLILLFSQEMMHVFGTEFIVGSAALILISIGQVVNAGVGSAGYINIMTGHPEYEFYNSLLTVLVNITLNYFLIPIYGIEGAAFASLISIGITNIIRLLLVYKEHKIHPYNLGYMKLFFSICISFIITYVLNVIINYLWIIQFIGLSALFVIIFISIYYLIGLSKEDNMILKIVINKVKN